MWPNSFTVTWFILFIISFFKTNFIFKYGDLIFYIKTFWFFNIEASVLQLYIENNV